MQSEAPLTLILSPLRAGRGELKRTCLGSLFGDSDTLPPKVPLSLRKRERVRVRVRLDCMDTAKMGTRMAFTVFGTIPRAYSFSESRKCDWDELEQRRKGMR